MSWEPAKAWKLRVIQLPNDKPRVTCPHRLYVVLDASDAFRGAIKLRRCSVSTLPGPPGAEPEGKTLKRYWGVSRLFTRLRNVQGFEAAKEVIDELNKFIKPIK
ncbi:hypothetical protein FHS27_004411 [Rhodopirellula rubra]|uniref:Uncharacterized protein n=1 Tax=Aporhodopirellula rubra TaxID=980271 RepID=A0A7W5H6I2_9BACT|nr:hypothetical protein [Aporhodopirellula rubra]MBB3208582.1 hypothetical protein [Aporhodopirellula rubra]